MANTANSLNPLLVSITRLVLALEPWFACFIMLMSTNAFIELYQEAGYGWTSRVNFYLWKFLQIAAFGFMVLRWQRVLRQISNGKFLIAFLAFLWISQYWSLAPAESKDHGMYVLESTLFGIYIATRYNFKEQTRLFTIMFCIVSVLSIFYVFAMPNLGQMLGPEAISAGVHGYWRGIFIHKNVLGRVITQAGIFLLIAPFTTAKNRWLALGDIFNLFSTDFRNEFKNGSGRFFVYSCYLAHCPSVSVEYGCWHSSIPFSVIARRSWRCVFGR